MCSLRPHWEYYIVLGTGTVVPFQNQTRSEIWNMLGPKDFGLGAMTTCISWYLLCAQHWWPAFLKKKLKI